MFGVFIVLYQIYGGGNSPPPDIDDMQFEDGNTMLYEDGNTMEYEN